MPVNIIICFSQVNTRIIITDSNKLTHLRLLIYCDPHVNKQSSHDHAPKNVIPRHKKIQVLNEPSYHIIYLDFKPTANLIQLSSRSSVQPPKSSVPCRRAGAHRSAARNKVRELDTLQFHASASLEKGTTAAGDKKEPLKVRARRLIANDRNY